MHVHDIRSVFLDPCPQHTDITQGAEPLAPDRPVQEFSTAIIDPLPERAVGRDDGYVVPVSTQVLGDFHGDQLRAANAEGHQGLYHVHDESVVF